MYKRLFRAALSLIGIMGALAIGPQTTQAYDDGIYTGLVDENGNGVITVIRSGVEMTIKSDDQPGRYNRGNNIAGDSTTYYGDVNNNRWGGSGDTYENGFNPNPPEESKIARIGPCDSGYHVPSRGEWNELVTAWCNLTEGCSLTVAYDQDRNSGSNKLIRVSIQGMSIKFTSDFSMTDSIYWSSSPFGGNMYNAWFLTTIYGIGQDNYYGDYGYDYYRSDYFVRCFKNSYVDPPQKFIVKFLDDGEEILSGTVIDGDTRIETPPIPASREGYLFDYRYADGTNSEFNFTAPITADTILHAKWILTATVPNGIYTMDNGDITVMWSDAIRGNINLTLAGINLEGYRWGFDYDTSNSEWSGMDGIGTYIGEDGKMYGNTYGVNDAWGGGEDTYANGFDSGNERYKRQGPCNSGYHVPSRGERNVLAIARCNIYTGCNARYSDSSEKTGGDLRKATGTYAWTENNKLIYINRSGLGTAFKKTFGLVTSFNYFWSSSPILDSDSGVWGLGMDDGNVRPNYASNRNFAYFLRCFKNYITIPPTIYTVTFLNEGGHIRSGEVESGSKILGEIINDYLIGLVKTGYNFSGWAISGSEEMFDVENDVVTTGMILNAVWESIIYTISFDVDGGSQIADITGYYNDTVTTPANPTKNGYTFKGRDREIPTTMPAESITIKAIWEKNGSSGGGGGGGGGGGSSATPKEEQKPTETPKDQTSSGAAVKEPESNTGNKAEIQTGNVVDTPEQVSENDNPVQDAAANDQQGQHNTQKGGTYFQEFQEAYEFAHDKGITTMPTIEKANMDGKLTRIAMAKMLSQYAMNVLGQKPANVVVPKFNDVTDKQNSDYDDGVTLAYQLGIMGQNMPGNNFRPNDEVTRAEFTTALSRMAYGTSDGEYKGTGKYYIHHMEKLIEEGIITKDDPNMKELRGYVMIMLMRSAK